MLHRWRLCDTAQASRVTPVVGTSIAAEGIPVITRREMLIADGAVSFADALSEVYRDESLWNTLAEKGKGVVANYFSRDVARTALTGLFRGLESIQNQIAGGDRLNPAGTLSLFPIARDKGAEVLLCKLLRRLQLTLGEGAGNVLTFLL